MKATKTGLVLALTLLFALPLITSAQQYKISKVKIHAPHDNMQRAELLGLLQIDHFYTDQDGGIISEINEMEIEKLKTTGYSYEILVPDVMKQLDSLNKIYYASLKNHPKQNDDTRLAIEQPGSTSANIIVTPAAFQVKGTYGGYYSYAEIVTAIDNLVAAYPSIAQKINIGTSTNGNIIWLVKISDNVAVDEPNEPEVLYMGLQHCREAIGGSSMIFFMQYLCERYSSDQRIKDLVDNREIYIIPCFNPDGWEYNRTNWGVNNPGGDWRKNRRNNGDGTFGVDLNRNWGADWSLCGPPISGSSTSCGSSTTSLDTYYGPGAFSEPETQAVRQFVKAHHLTAAFDQHSYGPYYSLPFGRWELHTMSQKGKDFFTAIPAAMGMYNGMRAADSFDALGYEVAGGFKDWMLMGELGSSIGTGLKDTVWAMTGEGSAGGGTTTGLAATLGTQNFWAPAAQIIPLSKSMCYQNLQLLYGAGTYVDIKDSNDIALASKTGNLNFVVRRLGIGNDPVTVQLVPIENMQSAGAPITIPSMVYYGNYVGSISYNLFPALLNGQRVKYAWKVTTAGYTYSDTVVKFLNPTQAFYDDMETAGNFATNWTSTSNVADKWAYTTLTPFAGTHSLTESPAGTYTGNTTRTLTYNGTFVLTGKTAAYLTFWTRYHVENFSDKMQLQISTNGGTSWGTGIAGSTTVQEPGILDGSTLNSVPSLTGIRDYWTPETYDLSAYLGQASVKFRFVFTSDAGTGTFKYDNDDGFYIDNLKVITSTTPLVVLPVNFQDFTGVLLPNQTVKLNWVAVTDQNHDHFEVERSADGINFISLGYGPNAAPYDYIDAHPNWGSNYYRIKQVDKSGMITYSKVVNIYVGSRTEIRMFPNPVKDVLQIKLNNRGSDQYQVQIADLQGRVIYSSSYMVHQDAAELRVDMKAFKPQVYVLKLTNGKGETIATEKVIKY
ncbi:MAG: M14 family zinc carboxypeptidase [Flavisolibacter sp.]